MIIILINGSNGICGVMHCDDNGNERMPSPARANEAGKIERKLDEIGTRVSCFIGSKLLKMSKNGTIIHQQLPPFSYQIHDHYHTQTHFTQKEIEQLFYFFRKWCIYPKEHLLEQQFATIFPPSFPKESTTCLYLFFEDIHLKKMGLRTISFKSFVLALSVMSRGSELEKLQYLIEIIFHQHSKTKDCDEEETLPLGVICDTLANYMDLVMPCIVDLPTLSHNDKLGVSIYKKRLSSSVGDLDMQTPLETYSIHSRFMTFQNTRGDSSSYEEILSLFEESEIKEDDPIRSDQVFGIMKGKCSDAWHSLTIMKCFTSWKYFHIFITDTMKHDLKSKIPTQDVYTQYHVEKEAFLTKNWQFGVFEKWKRHWCIVRDGFFWYYDCHESVPKIDEPERVVCLQRAKVKRINENHFALELPHYCRKFMVENSYMVDDWVNAISSHCGTELEGNFSSSPIRNGISATWFVDGKNTMSAIYDDINDAKQQIFIADWFLSPFVFLKRDGDTLDDTYRLDHILLSKAEAGVQIYILPWNETKLAMDLGTAETEEYFEGLHVNIHVIRHPAVVPIKWSHHQKIVAIDQDIAYVGGVDLCFGRWDDSNHSIIDPDSKQFRGKDYYNPFINEFENVHEPWKDLVDRTRFPRMPWHDIHMKVDGTAARDICRNFIQRWNHHKEDLPSPHRYLLPKNTLVSSSGCNSLQILRSVSEWSCGIGEDQEHSIYEGYIRAIQGARKYIYIENQFFISALSGDLVKNRIALCLVDKIAAAIEGNRNFKVIIVLPQHPEGAHCSESKAAALIMLQQYNTISRGKGSMIKELQSRYPDINIGEYIGFYTLRNFGHIRFECLLTEQIYVHSKVLLVDDRIAIIGSANINDRSMLGDRDSEIAVKVFGGKTVSSSMDGSPWKAVQFTRSLRIHLWKEHLGLEQDPIQMEDPFSVMALWDATARANSDLYFKLFPPIMKNGISFKYKEEVRTIPFTEDAFQHMQTLQGHLLLYDLEYCLFEDVEDLANLPLLDVFL